MRATIRAVTQPLYSAFVLLLYGLRRAVQAANRADLGRGWLDNGLVFTIRTGRHRDALDKISDALGGTEEAAP